MEGVVDGMERKRRKVNGWIRWKADIISGCESFITERRTRGESGARLEFLM